MILGPPASGKSTVAKQVAEFYKIHHVTVKELIDESMKNLERLASRSVTQPGTEGVLYRPPIAIFYKVVDIIHG